MDQPFYQFSILDNTHRFDFVSQGRQVIQKVIIYQATTIPDLYNLVLADVLPDGSFDVHTVSNNGDRDTVLATVAQTLVTFFDRHSTSRVIFYGSTPARTRLYQIGIAQELDKIKGRFEIRGITGSTIEPFQRNKNYEAFVFQQPNL